MGGRELEFRSVDGRFRVLISDGELEKLFTLSSEAEGKETGGVLVGRYSEDGGTALVTVGSPPPADSTSTPTSFTRGTKGLSGWLEQLWHADERWYYLGEWHCHPGSVPWPSDQDIHQMRAIALDRDYHCPEPILLIMSAAGEGLWTVRVFVIRRVGKVIELHNAIL